MDRRKLSRLLLVAAGLTLIIVSAFLANAGQAAQVDPCTTFPPVFPAGAPDTFLTFLELRVTENTTTAAAYYKAVDPLNRRTTLNDWLVMNGYINNPGDLTAGPTGDALVQKDAFAMYVNNVDLGVTRRFYLRKDAEGNISSYTENYRCLRDAKLRQNLLATVGMEWRDAEDGSNPGKRYVTFYAWGPNNERIYEIDLDGRGAKAIPGNCMICHGGNPRSLTSTGQYPNHGNVGASFLPWDITAFVFDTDPTLTRSAQEAQIRLLNLGAYATYNKTQKFDEVAGYKRPNALVEVVEGWYGGKNLPNPTFNDLFTPKGWRAPYAPPEAEALYHEVIATSCRSCHISRERSLDFTSLKAFMVFRDAHESLVFDAATSGATAPGPGDDGGVMPLALQTFNNFWNSNAHTALRNFLDTH